MNKKITIKNIIKISAVATILAIVPMLIPLIPTAHAAQGCALNSFYGTVTVDGVATDNVSVTLTDTTNGSPALTATTAGGGFYTIETANLATCAAVGDQISIAATFNGLTASTVVPYVAQASTNVNLAIVTPVITTITVSPASPSIVVGATQQFTATALDQNGAPMVPQPTFTWTSSSSTIATVDATGLATGVLAGGPITITATSGAVSGTANLTVLTPVLTSIVVSPTSTSIVVGATRQFTATALDQNGAPMVPQPTFTWTSSSSTIATVSTSGLATGVAIGGPVTITASNGAISGTANATIISPAITSIVLVPTSTSISIGATQQFTATALDQNGAPMVPQPTLTWTSSSSTIATVSTSGLATAIAVGGPVTITASNGAISGTANLTVVNPIITSITVTPASTSIPIGTTQQFTANVLDQYGTTIMPQPAITWSSSSSTIATVSTSGLATGVAIGGPVTITASNGAISGIANLLITIPAPVLTASPTPGNYNRSIDVTLSAPSSTVIRYTLDNTNPTCTTGTLYSTQIHVTSTVGIKAVACNGTVQSPVMTYNYSINYKVGEHDFDQLLQDDVFDCGATSTNTSTPQVTVHQEVEMDVADNNGTSTIIFPTSTIITRDDNSIFDATKLVAESEPESSLTGFGDSNTVVDGALHMGLPNLGLKFNPAIQINIWVGNNFNGRTLHIYRSVDGQTNWTDVGVDPTTCVVANGLCSFSATKASHYVAVHIASVNNGGGGGGGGGSVPPYQPFIVPASGLTLAINNGAGSTNNPNVTLQIFGGSDAKTMAISNSADFVGVAQENYATIRSWTLPGDNGKKTVYVKFFNSSGTASPVVQASISLGGNNESNEQVGSVEPQVLGEQEYANNTILQGPNGKLYLVVNGTIRPISSVKSLGSDYAKAKVYKVSTAVLNEYPLVFTANLKYGDGNLLRDQSTGQVYLIGNGMRQALTEAQLAKYKNPTIIDVDSSVLAYYPLVNKVTIGKKPYGNGVLLRNATNHQIYYIVNGMKKYINSLTSLKQYKVKRIYNVSDATLERYPVALN